MAQIKNPFTKSKDIKQRVKLFLYGDTGTGKTYTSLQFPDVCIIDPERGSTLYSDRFHFDVANTVSSMKDIEEILKFLSLGNHPYKTLVIDPLTMIWDMFQIEWNNIFLERNPQSKGNKFEYFVLQPTDWIPVKNAWKDFLARLLRLDMNIICTAREKTKYKKTADNFMTPMGETFSADKDTPYFFDAVIRTMKIDTQNGYKLMGLVEKDRNEMLGVKQFDLSFELFRNKYRNIMDKSQAIVPSDEMVVEINGLIHKSGINQEVIRKRLVAKYGVSSISELLIEQAEEVKVGLLDMAKKKEEAKEKEKIAKETVKALDEALSKDLNAIVNGDNINNVNKNEGGNVNE